MGMIIGLLICGVILVIAELVIPGGVVGIVGLICLTAGVVLGFMDSATLGFGLLLGVVVFGFLAFVGWINLFPKSPIGQRMFLASDGKEWRGFDDSRKELVGKRGEAHTMLRPSGTALIEGKRVDVVSEGGVIERGDPIEVVQVEGSRIVVALREETDSAAEGETGAEGQPASA